MQRHNEDVISHYGMVGHLHGYDGVYASVVASEGNQRRQHALGQDSDLVFEIERLRFVFLLPGVGKNSGLLKEPLTQVFGRL